MSRFYGSLCILFWFATAAVRLMAVSVVSLVPSVSLYSVCDLCCYVQLISPAAQSTEMQMMDEFCPHYAVSRVVRVLASRPPRSKATTEAYMSANVSLSIKRIGPIRKGVD